jgi:hypothetical protein
MSDKTKPRCLVGALCLGRLSLTFVGFNGILGLATQDGSILMQTCIPRKCFIVGVNR